MKTKICYRCKKRKPIEKFRKHLSGVNKGYYNSYCKNCEKKQMYEKNRTIPWYKTFCRIRSRCSSPGHYHKRNIKNKIKRSELKFLWFRDKAYLMSEPSIDRIDSSGDYTLANCRYMELKENKKRPKLYLGRVLR